MSAPPGYSDRSAEPGRDCPLCPRLVAYRQANRHTFPEFHNAPASSFGPLEARLLVVGLAPALRGANATGRPFTGDHSGGLLFRSLGRCGFARGTYDPWANDDLAPIDCRITNAVRCVPPQNRPTGAEVTACRPFLEAEVAAMPRLRVIAALGRIAHQAIIAVHGLRHADRPFAHGAVHALSGGRQLIDSYHPSRQNTNTGRLTPAMLDAVFANARELLDARDAASV